MVWNDDEIAHGIGFGWHGDMQIIIYVRQGVGTHKDNVGNIGRTMVGDVR